jgi:uncharacterized protein (TIGR00369 family)
LSVNELPTSPFARTIGIELLTVGDERATASLTTNPAIANAQGGLHGGGVAALIDFASGTAVMVGDGGPATRPRSTVSMTVQYLEGVRSGTVVAEGIVIRRGRSLCVCEVRVHDDRDRLVATALVTYRMNS